MVSWKDLGKEIIKQLSTSLIAVYEFFSELQNSLLLLNVKYYRVQER